MAETQKEWETPDHGKKQKIQWLLRFLVAFLTTAAITTAFFIARNGIPVWGGPKPEKVAAVRVELLTTGHTKVVTDPADIKTACRLINFLNYQPFTPADTRSPSEVAVTYQLKDGRELTAQASWITGWWNGEAHALKQPDLFVNLVEGLFFSQESRENHS